MPVIYMDRASAESLTEKDIREIIDENLMDLKYGMLTDYYVGQHRILSETKKDSTAPNNRLVNNMAKYITDTATSYFVGQPVVYNSQDDAYLQTVQDIFDYNDEQDHNMELAKQCSICGSCFEMLYLDEDAQIRFAKVAPSDLIMIYESDSGHAQPMAAIRSVRSVDKDKNVILKVEFWNAYQVLRFRSFNNGYLNLEAIEDHLQRFLYHLLTAMNLNQYKSQGAQPGLAVKNLENLIAPVPALDVQERLVRVLDNFESICTDLNIGLPAEIKARQKQYEYYRDLLLTFAETGSTLVTDRQTDRQTGTVESRTGWKYSNLN